MKNIVVMGGQEWGIGAYNGTSSCNGGKV